VAAPAPGVALPRRRPQRTATPRRRPLRATSEPRGIALRAIDAFEGLSSSRLLDRLIRSRLWIGLLAFALIGIVAMQLLVLEMNTNIGRKLARVAQLQLANAQLGIEDSGASGEARIDPLAAASGMTFAPSGSVHFVATNSADVARAASVLATVAKAPVPSTSETSSSESSAGETSPSSTTSSTQVAESTGSEASSSTASAETASSSGQSTAAATESSPSATGTTASSATSPETSSASQAAPPTGAAGGVQAGVGE
jgi:hypothetical protein